MTLPIEHTYPSPNGKTEDAGVLQDYLTLLTRDLAAVYEDQTIRINGRMVQFTPVLADTGSGATYTYTHQTGWYLRQGIMTDVWFDVEWTAVAGGPVGNLFLRLPYAVANSNDLPFIGVVQTETFAYPAGTGYIIINGRPNTFRGEFFGSGSGIPTANLPASTAAGRLIGHLRYIGKENE